MACHAAVRANRALSVDRDERAAARDGGDRALGQLQPRPPDLVPAHHGRPRQAVPARPMSGVMIVTGGGRGIGAATARLAAQARLRGLRQLPARRRASAERLVQRDRQRQGDRACRATSRSEADVLRLFKTVDEKLGRAERAGEQRRHRRPRLARRGDVGRAHPAHVRDQRHRQLPVRARGGEAHVDAPRRQGRRDRQRLVDGGEARRRRRVRRLRRLEGRDRHPDRRPRARKSAPKASASTACGRA